MSVHRDWRGRLPALAYPTIGAEAAALAWPPDGQRPFIPRAGCRDLTVILVATLRGGRRSGFAQFVALPSKSRSRPAGSLCGSA